MGRNPSTNPAVELAEDGMLVGVLGDYIRDPKAKHRLPLSKRQPRPAVQSPPCPEVDAALAAAIAAVIVEDAA